MLCIVATLQEYSWLHGRRIVLATAGTKQQNECEIKKQAFAVHGIKNKLAANYR